MLTFVVLSAEIEFLLIQAKGHTRFDSTATNCIWDSFAVPSKRVSTEEPFMEEIIGF